MLMRYMREEIEEKRISDEKENDDDKYMFYLYYNDNN